MSLCRYCGKAIRFVVTESDRKMPLDAAPDPAGNVIIRDGRAVVVGPGVDVIAQRWMPHAASCPWAQRRTARHKSRAARR